MRHLIIILTLIATLLLPTLASADDTSQASPWIAPVVTPLAKGALAPFAGVLLTPEAVARVIADAKDCPKRAQVEVDHAVGVEKANGSKALADAASNAKRDREVLQAGLDQRDGTIKDLTTALQKSENARGNTWLWVGGGAAFGVVVTVLSVVVISYVK